ncbi:MAG: glycosyltransferase [Lamprobacter sp.]|uniref:glycosyltransferase n=1 Tax=Lamprobacter sp. TaxID=3100796 RepID=UPI002B263544|nr:glycosyltransferase [Lamprobacter sp.]MEA3641089.1 glycosyltransferase [Lamprobacter sp.]
MDRVDAVHRHLSDRFEIIGIELTPKSSTYAWESRPSKTFEKRTVFADRELPSLLMRVRKMLAHMPPPRQTCFFLCHYQDPAIFLLAAILRVRGGRVSTMNNSKFDDKPRSVWKEVGKSLFLLPYHGVLSTGTRSNDYWRFLGLKAENIAAEYNTVSIERIRRQARVPPAPNGPAFEDRHFTAIARLVPKKNLSMLLSAYALYRQDSTNPRPLHLCGSGPDEAALRQQAADLGIAEQIVFRGWLQDAAISQTLGQTLALLLPSVEEQFGNVVIEAQAMGLPVILSVNCGARDLLVRSGVNGFVIEPDNPQGMAYFMGLLSDNEDLWQRMCRATNASASLGDVQRFVDGVEALTS